MKPGAKSIFIFTVISLMTFSPDVFAQNKTYDIEHYSLEIIPDFVRKTLNLRTTILIDNPELQNEILFGLNDLYHVVKVASATSSVEVNRTPGWINIKIEKPTREMTLTMELKGAPGKSNDENRYVISDSSLFLLWSDRFYPIDFNDWAIVRTSITLPSGFQAIAPGRIMNIRNKDGKVLYIFETSHPTVCFSVLADCRWIKTEKKLDGLRMWTLLYPQSQKFVRQIFNTSREILEFYSETYGPYPFDQFSFVTMDDIYARRAFPGFIGYNPQYLEKEFTRTGHDAHETALLWWFYTIRGNGPGGFQWTEGFGDYAEFLYDEVYNKPIPEIFQYFRKKYLEQPFENDVPYHQLRGDTPQEIVHGKYPWLMHVLRYVVGDSAFQPAMRSLFARFQFRTFTMSEFISTLEAACGQSLRWWREEWLERKGVPTISLRSEIHKNQRGGYRILVHLEQLGLLYHLPIEIGIQTVHGIRLEKVYLSRRRMTVSFHSFQKPTAILLDPNGWLLIKKVVTMERKIQIKGNKNTRR